MDTYFDQVFQQLEETEAVNPYTIYELKELLENDDADLKEIERLCFSIVSNLFDDRPLLELQSSDNKVFWYDYLQLHIYLILKGKSENQNSSLIFAGISTTIAQITSDLFTQFGVENKLLPLVVSLTLCVAIKLPAKAWCSYFYDTKVRNNDILLNSLKEMENSNDSGKI